MKIKDSLPHIVDQIFFDSQSLNLFFRFLLFYSFERFSHQHLQMVFHWGLWDSESPQISRIQLSILPDINNAVVWKITTCTVISKSSSHFINPFETLTSTWITIGFTVPFVFHSFFFYFSSKVQVLSHFLLSYFLPCG